MTVPVTGGSRSVDEETLHEFHLGFFGFIFTCNFSPVYFSPIPPPSLPLPPSSRSFTCSQPSSAPLPALLRSSLPHHPSYGQGYLEAQPRTPAVHTRGVCTRARDVLRHRGSRLVRAHMVVCFHTCSPCPDPEGTRATPCTHEATSPKPPQDRDATPRAPCSPLHPSTLLGAWSRTPGDTRVLQPPHGQTTLSLEATAHWWLPSCVTSPRPQQRCNEQSPCSRRRLWRLRAANSEQAGSSRAPVTLKSPFRLRIPL